MIEFTIVNDGIELKHYDPDTTLTELVYALDAFRQNRGLKTDGCKGCGECCGDNIPVLGLDLPVLLEGLGINFEQAVKNVLILPEKPDITFRRKAIKEMAESTSISILEATLLFEYNNAEPIILAKQKSGACCFLQDNLCSRYSIRPYSCSLYLCNMGERLSCIQEMIVRQGTWHAYSRLGWIDAGEISHNPFLKAHSYDKLLVSDFEFRLNNALEKLFFYF